MSWIHCPEATALLASCARRPPPRRLAVYRFEETALRFVGRRVRRLSHLYRLAEPPVDTPAWREWLALDPQQAIAAAIGRRASPPSPLFLFSPESRDMDDQRPDPVRRHSRMIAAFCDDLASPDYRRCGGTPRADALSDRHSSRLAGCETPFFGKGHSDEWQP